jgi:hypothetical protein
MPASQSQSAVPDQYSEEETQRRFEALVRAALNTPPAPLKDRPKKRRESKPERDK